MIASPDLFWGEARSGWDLWNAINRRKWLLGHQGEFDIVHALETRPATIYPVLALLRRRPMPFLTDWIDWWGRGGLVVERRPLWWRVGLGWIETYYEEAFRRRADGVTVISQALGERAAKLGVEPERIAYIPGGSDLERFSPLEKSSCRRELRIPEGAPVIGFSGLDCTQDLDLVLSAFLEIRKRFPDVHLITTGKYLHSVDAFARDHEVSAQVIQFGFLPLEDLNRHLCAADVFLVPMRDTPANRGRWPNKVADYLAMGRPIVGVSVGEVKHLLDRYEVGISTKATAESLASGTIELLSDPTRAAELGRAARQVAETDYSWSEIVIRLEEFYVRTVQRFRKGADTA